MRACLSVTHFIRLFVTLCAVALQAPLSMEFSRREYKWVVISYSRGSPQPRNRTCISCIGRWILYHWATWEAQHLYYPAIFWIQATISSHVALPHLFQISRWSIFETLYNLPGSLPIAQMVKNLPAMQDTRVLFLGWEVPLGKGMAIYFSILACRIPWPEMPGRLQSQGSQRVGHDWVSELNW